MNPPPTITIQQFDLHDRRRLRQFVDFPYDLYRNDPHWIPRLRMEYLGNHLLGQVGMFQTEFAFHQNASSSFFLAFQNSKIVGRISASIDHAYNKFHQTQMGSFGFFECIDDQEVANQLLETAESWCRKQGALQFLGPLNFSTNHTCGILVNAFDRDPIIEMPYNPSYFPRLLEGYGLKKIKDLLSFNLPFRRDPTLDERFKKIAPHVQKRLNLKIRPINPKHLQKEVRLFVEFYNATWKNNWGFVPITLDEADQLAKNLKIILEPSIFVFGEINGEAVGVAGTLPDLNWALRRKIGTSSKSWQNSDLWRTLLMFCRKSKIHGGRMMLYGIKESHRNKGIESLLITSCMESAVKLGYDYGDAGWILEDNQATIRGMNLLNATHYKTYRIYGLI